MKFGSALRRLAEPGAVLAVSPGMAHVRRRGEQIASVAPGVVLELAEAGFLRLREIDPERRRMIYEISDDGRAALRRIKRLPGGGYLDREGAP